MVSMNMHDTIHANTTAGVSDRNCSGKDWDGLEPNSMSVSMDAQSDASDTKTLSILEEFVSMSIRVSV